MYYHPELLFVPSCIIVINTRTHTIYNWVIDRKESNNDLLEVINNNEVNFETRDGSEGLHYKGAVFVKIPSHFTKIGKIA